MRTQIVTTLVIGSLLFSQACTTKPTVYIGSGSELMNSVEFITGANVLAQDLTEDAQTEQDSKLDQAYVSMVQGCKAVMSSYEREAQNYKYLTVLIAVTGAAAGGVAIPALTAAAPLANKAAIAAVGGLSGVTNLAQATMTQQGLSAEEALLTRNNIRTDLKVAIDDYLQAVIEGSPTKKAAAIAKGAGACTNYVIHSPDLKAEKKTQPATP